jgi:hypothetical protein
VKIRVIKLVFLEESFVSYEFFWRACDAYGDFLYHSRFDGNIDFDSGEMLAMLPYSKESGEGIMLLSQPICLDGIKYFDSIAYMEFCLGGTKASCTRKSAQ